MSKAPDSMGIIFAANERQIVRVRNSMIIKAFEKRDL